MRIGDCQAIAARAERLSEALLVTALDAHHGLPAPVIFDSIFEQRQVRCVRRALTWEIGQHLLLVWARLGLNESKFLDLALQESMIFLHGDGFLLHDALGEAVLLSLLSGKLREQSLFVLASELCGLFLAFDHGFRAGLLVVGMVAKVLLGDRYLVCIGLHHRFIFARRFGLFELFTGRGKVSGHREI